MNVLTGGTDVHLVLVDLRESELDGQQAEDRLAEVGITVNRNAVPFDPRPPAVSSGLRIGTPALATRGLQTEDFAEVGRIIAAALQPDFDGRRAELTERVQAIVDGGEEADQILRASLAAVHEGAGANWSAIAFVEEREMVAGPLADRVFEPLLAPGGALAGSVGQLIGVGKGRGMGLMLIGIGVAIVVVVAVASRFPRLTRLESDLPDALEEAA